MKKNKPLKQVHLIDLKEFAKRTMGVAELYPWQVNALNAIEKSIKNSGAVSVYAPSRLGKSWCYKVLEKYRSECNI